MDDHNENINLDDISIEDIMKNNYSEQDRQEEDFGSDDFNETHFTSDEEEITIDDSDLRRIEERYESDMRDMDNLKKQCPEKKQEIQTLKDIILSEDDRHVLKDVVFSNDCINDKEIIYSNIETETCKSIKEYAFHISQNIRTNRRTAKTSLRNLKRDTDLLTLQFEYTDIIEQILTTQSGHNKLKRKCDQVKLIISGFDAIRKERRKQACREKEVRDAIKKAEDIMNQQ